VETAKKGGCPEDHLGIKNRIKKNSCKLISTKKCHTEK
jgi:hypothetical protein